MLINGSNKNVNILILLMENEIDVTVNAIETLLAEPEEGVTISVLLNGGKSDYLKELFDAVPNIQYYESEQNLGVAGGRNFLLDTKECTTADIVMVLDNDVVPPLDYVRKLSAFLMETKGAGVVGGVAADINHADYSQLTFHGEKGCWNHNIFRLKCADIKQNCLRDLNPSRIFHMGANEDIDFTYFSLKPFLAKFLNKFGRLLKMTQVSVSELKHSHAHLALIKDGATKYRVSNVAGCSQAFRRDLVEEIGGLNNLFNPYGFEDAEFCLRAIKAGYSNYIDLDTWLYHGTDGRHEERVNIQSANSRAEKHFKGRTILAGLYFRSRWKVRASMYSVMMGFVLESLYKRKNLGLKGMLIGYKTGVRRLFESNVFP